MKISRFNHIVVLVLCIYLFLIPTAFAANPIVEITSQEGFPQKTSYSISVPPILYDLDGDGHMEVIVASNHVVHVYGSNGLFLWSAPVGISTTVIQTVPVVSDIDDDGDGEIITSGFESLTNQFLLGMNPYASENYVYVFNSTTSKFPTSYATPGSSVLIDLDGDGIDEVVIATDEYDGYSSKPPKLFAFDDSSELWSYVLPSPAIVTTSPAVGELNNDGSPDVVVILSGSDDVVAYSVDGTGVNGELWSISIPSSSTTRTAVIGNVYGDADNEVVVSTDNEIFVLSGTTGSVIWSVGTDPIIYSSPVIGDIDNDGSNEIVFGSVTGNVYALKGSNGVYMPNFPVNAGDDVWSTPALVDFDGDNKKEIVVGCWDGNVYAWHSDGTLVNGFPIEGTSVITSSPAIADIDNDGDLELAIGADNYNVYVWNLYVIIPPIVIIDSPSSESVFLDGETVSFDGSSSYDDNSISSYSWSSSIDGILSTSASFSVSSMSLGDHTITLEVTDNENAVNSSSILVYVNEPPTVAIDNPVDNNISVWNDEVTFSCTALDTDGTIASYNWVSDINGTIGTSDVFTTSSLMPGIHEITITVNDNKGTPATDSISIEVNIPPVVSIISPTQNSIFDYGESVAFNGTATDEDGTIVAHSWISDKDGVIGSDDVFTISNLTSGIHNIVFSASDNDGTERSTSLQIKINAPPDSDTSSGGGSGGGGTSGEEYENIANKDVKREHVNKGLQVSYEFDSTVEAVEFTGKTNAGSISVTIEELHHTSVFVNEFASGKVYKNLNIWVGNVGYATENNIEDATVRFSVERSWIKMNNVDKNTVKLNRYHDDKWNPLATELIDEDDSYFYFISKTPGFSPFSITGNEKVMVPPVLMSDTMTSVVPEQVGTLDDDETLTDDSGSDKESNNNILPAFEVNYSILAFVAAVLIMSKKRYGLK